MTPHQTVAVAVRLFAIWFLIWLIPSVLGFYAQFLKHDDPSKLLIAVVVTIVAAGLLLALWFFPQTIARGLLRTTSSESTPGMSADTWLAVGCALIGLWVLASGLPGLIRDSLILLYFSDDTSADTTQVKQWLFYDCAQIIVAVWLILGAKGVRKAIWWARNAGVGESSNNRPSGP
jgi:hypothetical protein